MTPSPYRVRVMGPPAVLDPSDQPRSLPAGKPLALLYYLTRHPDGATREELCDLLWSGRERARALHSLRQALWRIRSELDDDVLAETEPVAPVPGRVTSDVAMLEQALDAGELDSADKLWRSAPFQHLAVRGEPGWERWADGERLKLERRYAAALRAEAARALDDGRAEDAAVWAGRAIQVLPSSDVARDLLLEALLARRDLQGARRALDAARAQAADDPARQERLDRVDARIRAIEGEPGASGDGGPGPRDPLLVGRGQAFEGLMTLWRTTREGRARVAIMTGYPGCGRHAVTTPVRAAARADGAREVHLSLLQDHVDLRWSTLHDLVRELLPLSGAAGVSHASDRILRALVPSRAEPGSGPSRPPAEGIDLPEVVLLADALLDLLDAVTDDRPLLLTLEHLDCADESSWDVLRLVLRDVGDLPLLVVTTDRTTGPGRGRSRALDSLGEHEHVRTIALEPWTPEDIGALLEQRPASVRMTRAEDTKELTEYLMRHGGGHPRTTLLLLDALMAGADGSGEPELATGPPDEDRLPRTVRERLNDRLDALESAPCRIAGQLARAGGPAHPDELIARAGISRGSGLDAIEGLQRGGLVRWSAEHPDRIDFMSPALRQVATGRVRGGSWAIDSKVVVAERRDRRRRRLAVAALLLLVLTGGGLGAWWLDRVDTGPLDGDVSWGTVVAQDISTGRAWIVEPDRDGVRSIESLELPAVDGGSRVGRVWIDRNGDPHWFVSEREADEKPWISRISPDGRHVVRRTAGDDYLEDVSPDGRWALVRSEPVGADSYRLDLWLVPLGLDGGDHPGDVPLRLVEAENRASPARFSPDGRRIAVVREGIPDSLLVVTPSGQRVMSAASEAPIEGIAWCGGSPGVEPWLAATLDGPRGDRLFRLDPNSGTFEAMDEAGFVSRGLACSPQGDRLVYTTAIEGELTLAMHDFRASETRPVSELDGALHLYWVSGESPGVPSRLRLSSPDTALHWGHQTEIQARLERGDGSAEPATDLQWTSGDPAVATVTGDGRLHANGPGETWIRAEWDGWLVDSARVEVDAVEPEAILLSDDLSTLDPARWIQVGTPPAHIVERDGQSVLLLAGDAMYYDGITTREALALPRGGTLEAEFSVRLTREDKQWFWLCLLDGGLASTDAHRIDYDEITIRQRPCVRFPIDSFSRLRSDGLSYTTQRWGGRLIVPTPDQLPTTDWTHVALQFRPDGELSIWVNREHAFTAPLHIENDPDTRWRALLVGASVDTEVLVRNVRLWDGPRYR